MKEITVVRKVIGCGPLGAAAVAVLCLHGWPANAQTARLNPDTSSAAAEYKLGTNYDMGRGVPLDYGKAAEFFGKAADQGYAPAENMLGVYYDEGGKGEPQDSAKAVYWYRKAAQQGNAHAEDNLCAMYYNGAGVVKDRAQAAVWCRKAAAEFQNAASQGDMDAEKWLAEEYDKYDAGFYGLKTDATKSADWYRRAAEQDDADAADELADYYRLGEGVPEDPVKEAHWYREASAGFRGLAEKGMPSAADRMGFYYELGDGVPKDHAAAVRWYDRAEAGYLNAARLGYAAAECEVASLYQRRDRDDPTYDAKSAYWYRKAADQGYVSAENRLGSDYELGIGVAEDYGQAAYWYGKAAAQGFMLAKRNLADLEGRDGGPSPIKLYGVGVKGVTRSELESVLAKHGFTPLDGHIGSHWWSDEYKVNGEVNGASELMVLYTEGQRFAVAEYTFPSESDPGQIRRVVSTVKAKYGEPGLVDGDYAGGPVTVSWFLKNGMQIKVSRGWPDTTTYMDLEDAQTYKWAKYEMKKDKAQQAAAQAKKQSAAF